MIVGTRLFITLRSLKLLVVVAAAALTAKPAEAAFPGPNHRNGLIVFQGNSKIFTIDPNAGNPNSTIRQLTTNGYNPAWSPDGRRIAFSSTRDGRDREIYVMNADGTNPVRLTYNPGLDDDPAWSPDGRKIAFVSNPRGGVSHSEIYVMKAVPENPFTNRPQQVTFDPNNANDDQPNWSISTRTAPNGKIAFTKHRGASRVYVMNADGSNPTPLTNNSIGTNVQSFDPNWSPDGKKIAFTRFGPGINFDVWTLNAAIPENTTTNRAKQVTTDPGYDRDPAWSPGGTMIAFRSQRGSTIGDIFTINAAAPESPSNPARRFVIPTTDDSKPDWQPR